MTPTHPPTLGPHLPRGMPLAPPSPRIVLHFLVLQLERARTIIQKRTGGLGKLCVVMDYVGFTLRNAPTMRASMATLNIVQNHYPETLGQAFFVSPPFVFRSFWKVNEEVYGFGWSDASD